MARHSEKHRGPRDRFAVYRFSSASHESVIVLAIDLWAAVRVLRLWRITKKIGEAPFQVEPRWGRDLSRGGRAHLDEAVQRCRVSSVLTAYTAGTGWTLKTFADHGNDP